MLAVSKYSPACVTVFGNPVLALDGDFLHRQRSLEARA